MKGRLLAVAAAAVAVLYGSAWRFDLQCDDLLMVRPWSAAALSGVWNGTWEPQHVFPVFFRPLPSWFFAGTFELFGVHAPAHLLVSLLLLVAVVFALALFVARETESVALGAFTAVIYAAHPNTPWSTGVWVMNDFHKLAALAVLAALLLWQRVRHRPAAAWWPIALAAAAAFLVKEDNIMLIPALLAAQWMRARIVRDVAPPPAELWAAGALISAGFWMWRWSALGQLGGFPLPSSFAMVLRNLARGPYYALTLQGDESTGFTLAALAAGAVAVSVIAWVIARTTGLQRWLAVFALLLMAAYDAPLALISSVTRYYVLTMAAATVLAVAGHSLWARARTMPGRAGAALIIGTVLLGSASRQQHVHAEFAQCGRLPLVCRGWMLETNTTLPPEARASVIDMGGACQAARPRRFDAGDVLTWGLDSGVAIDTMTGARSREAGAHIVTLLRATATTATVTFRHPAASAAAPIDVAIEVNGREVQRLHLTSAEWASATVPLNTGWRTWLRGMHRADVQVTAGGTPRAGLEWQSFVPRD